MRDKCVHVRLREDEYKRWEQAARKAGMSLSQWARANLGRLARMT